MLYVAMMVLPLSALVARRLPIGDTIKAAFAWIAFFGLLYLVVVTWQQATGVGASARGLLGI